MLLGAQASGADVLALAVGGNDPINVLKQAAELGLRGKMRNAALVTFLGDIHGAGRQTMQGLLFTSSFYWDLNDRTRAQNHHIALMGKRTGKIVSGRLKRTCSTLQTAGFTIRSKMTGKLDQRGIADGNRGNAMVDLWSRVG